MRTLGGLWLALQVQGAAGLAPDSVGSNAGNLIVNLISRSTVVAKFVILVLALFSIVSWGVILYKSWTFSRASKQSTQFLDVFRRSNKFSEVQAVCRSLTDSPLVGLFQSGYTELTTQLRQAAPADVSNGPNPKSPPARPTIKSLNAVDRALMRASVVEVTKLEHWIPFLATTASVTPFIGLFGTVWGILVAFEQIGITGTTSIAAVGPGISEALVTTALGLFAAIPAVMAYNHLTNQVKSFASDMDDFSMEFLNIAERNFT
ncbi:MAG TPA: MotA/TolQ/ExbB proton channel family protein [Vicinamibacterales bacterium]|nr:MotA/TolQ/ExbB proton channel family protein [Vicinamibacterales bacterium]